jgi:hypothetical protein
MLAAKRRRFSIAVHETLPWGFEAEPVRGKTMAHTVANNAPHLLITGFGLDRFARHPFTGEKGAALVEHQTWECRQLFIGLLLSARWVRLLPALESSPSIISASKAEGGLTDGG